MQGAFNGFFYRYYTPQIHNNHLRPQLTAPETKGRVTVSGSRTWALEKNERGNKK